MQIDSQRTTCVRTGGRHPFGKRHDGSRCERLGRSEARDCCDNRCGHDRRRHVPFLDTARRTRHPESAFFCASSDPCGSNQPRTGNEKADAQNVARNLGQRPLSLPSRTMIDQHRTPSCERPFAFRRHRLARSALRSHHRVERNASRLWSGLNCCGMALRRLARHSPKNVTARRPILNDLRVCREQH